MKRIHVTLFLTIVTLSPLGSCACDEPNNASNNVPMAFPFTVDDPGTGEPNEEPLWPMNVGSFMEGEWVIEGYEDNAFRVVLANADYFDLSEFEAMTVRDAGESFQVVESGSGGQVGLTIPKVVRDGMKFRVGDVEASVELVGTREVWGVERRVWKINGLPGTAKEFVEGMGPTEGGYGVLVEDSRIEGITGGTRTEVSPVYGGAIGMSRMDSVVTDTHAPMLMIRAHRTVIGNPNQTPFQRDDFCIMVDAPQDSVRPLNVKSIFPGVHYPGVDRCPATLLDDASGDWIRTTAATALPFDTGVTYYFDGQLAAHKLGSENYILGSLGEDIIGVGRLSRIDVQSDGEIAERGEAVPSEWGVVNDVDAPRAISLDIDADPGRVLLYGDGWVHAASLDADGTHAPTHGLYLPGAYSTQLRDDERVLTRTMPDGLVHRIHADDGVVTLTREGRPPLPPDGTVWAGAAHVGSDLVMMITTPGDWLSTDDFLYRMQVSSTPVAVPSSLGVRITSKLHALRVCLPPGEDAESVNLRINDNPPLHAFRMPDEDGGCLAVVPDPPFSTELAVELELPDVGLAKSYITTHGGDDVLGVPTRNRTIEGTLWAYNEFGFYSRRGPNGDEFRGNIHRDGGGHGVWIRDTSGARLMNSDAEWPEIFRAGISAPFSSLGRVLVKRRADDGGACQWLDKEGTLTDVDCETVFAADVRIVAELDDGTLCFFSDAAGIWCGAIDTPEPTGAEPTTLGFVVPTQNGFYFRADEPGLTENVADLSGEPVEVSFYDRDTHTITEMGVLEGPYRVADDLVVAVRDGQVVRLTRGESVPVFDATTVPGWVDSMSIIPLDGTVLVGGVPLAYEPRDGNCTDQLEVCNGLDDNCNDMVDEETDRPLCEVANGTGSCTPQGCGISMCAPGFDDCDGDVTNGCEASLDDVLTCGSCGVTCQDGGCVDRMCAIGFVSIEGGVDAICAAHAGGAAWCIGASRAAGITTVPTQVPPVVDAIGIRVGGEHTCAVPLAGAPLCWGVNAEDQLPVSTPAIIPLADARPISAFAGARDLQMGASFSAYINDRGELWCSGTLCRSNFGGTTNLNPTQIGAASDWVNLVAGGKRNSTRWLCAVSAAGTMQCAGSPLLGWTSTMTTQTADPVLQMWSGLEAVVARTNAGYVAAGKLAPFTTLAGNGALPATSGTAVTIAGLDGATHVATGDDFVCAVFTGGVARCSKDFSCAQTATPDAAGWYDVSLVMTASAVATTQDAACFIDAVGRVICAGVDTTLTCDWAPVGFPE